MQPPYSINFLRGFKMNKVLISALLALAASMSACIVASGPNDPYYYYDSVLLNVTENTTVVDMFGFSQYATCNGNVWFSGQADHRCVPPAIEYSDATSGTLRCTYFAEDGVQDFDDLVFDFAPGYIQDSCYYASALTADNSTPAENTTRLTDGIPAPSASTAREPMKYDPVLQPQFKDGLIHATQVGSLTLTARKRLGSNMTFEDWTKAHPNAFVRKLVLTPEALKKPSSATAPSAATAPAAK
jgi:hypothetical protein